MARIGITLIAILIPASCSPTPRETLRNQSWDAIKDFNPQKLQMALKQPGPNDKYVEFVHSIEQEFGTIRISRLPQSKHLNAGRTIAELTILPGVNYDNGVGINFAAPRNRQGQIMFIYEGSAVMPCRITIEERFNLQTKSP